MKEKEKKSTIFLKILLVLVSILIGLAFYADQMVEEYKVNVQNKSNIKVEVKNTPMYHPPLKERDEIKEDVNESVIFTDENKTSTIPEGAEYITPEELLEREEIISEGVPLEEIYDDGQIIPQDKVDNYPVAVTVPISPPSTVEIKDLPPVATNNSLGTLISKDKNNNNNNNNNRNEGYHPSLGTKIKDKTNSSF